jgi:hypothetical protein
MNLQDESVVSMNAALNEAISGETVMRRRNKFYFSIIIFLGLIGELILLDYIASTSAQAVETVVERTTNFAGVELSRRSLNLVSLVPVTSQGQTVGIVAIYDNPVTPRREDYLELYDSGGELVAVGWFDQFGIRRMIVDRALVEGEDRFQRIFVTLVNGESI